MRNSNDNKSKLLKLLREKSVFFGSFKLSSGATSNYYIDCELTTLNPEGALLVGQVLYEMIDEKASSLGIKIDAVGGLTMGGDPVGLDIGVAFVWHNPLCYLDIFF